MNNNGRPAQFLKLKSVEELFGISGEESHMEIEIRLIHSFYHHPFKVLDDDKMNDLAESIKENGILSPVIIRPADNGEYEMISGHRRMRAAQLAGMEKIPAIILDMTDDEAIIAMVDANIQREELLPSEKAFAYKMKMDAMRHQGLKNDLTLDQNGPKLTAWSIGEGNGISGTQVKRYIRLTELIPELLELVDQKRIQFTVAVEMSYIDREIQKWLYEYIRNNGQIKMNQITTLRKELMEGAMTEGKMISLLNNSQPGKVPPKKLTLSEKQIKKYFPPDYTMIEIRDVIEKLLINWNQGQKQERNHDGI